jgi:hypothetical protein
MAMIPEVANDMLVPIVDRLSQEIILNSSSADWETTVVSSLVSSVHVSSGNTTHRLFD